MFISLNRVLHCVSVYFPDPGVKLCECLFPQTVFMCVNVYFLDLVLHYVSDYFPVSECCCVRVIISLNHSASVCE